jgi:hypothetical protein
MNQSQVYRKLNFLLQLKDATVAARKNMITNMTGGHMKAIAQVAKRLVNGTINPPRRDVQLLERRQNLLRSLASENVSLTRKKSLLRRHHSFVSVLLRPPYLLDTIMDEIRTTREA